MSETPARFTQGRKRQPFTGRVTPCECCSFPLSDRHHLLPFRHYGEHIDGSVSNLCPTCHSIFHLFFDGSQSKRSVAIINHLVTQALLYRRSDDRALSNRLARILRLASNARRMEVELCTQILALQPEHDISSYYEQAKSAAIQSLDWLAGVEATLNEMGISHPSALEMVLGGTW